ncbi:MAG: hypothetical protein V1817_03940 [Candidatus Micrarchaeota archaeon]
MVLKCEACCPKCFTRNQYVYKLDYDDVNKHFVCTHDSAHVFVEGEDGYLRSKV